MIDVAMLEQWLDASEIGTGPVGDVRPLAGGSQNIILRFRRGDEDFVLRRPPAHPRPESNETMRREARVLAALRGTDVPHPELIAACGDETVLGAAFYLMRPVDGFNPASGLAPLHAGSAEVRHRLGLALVEGVAALHALDPVTIGLSDFGKAEGYLDRQVARWQRQFAGYADTPGWTGAADLPALERLSEWLVAHQPPACAPGILHGDYHLANVMVRPDAPELAAIVDWELATIGDPLIDLGWLLATWPAPDGTGGTLSIQPWQGFPTSEELVAHYAARSARDLANIGWYRVFAAWKLAILLEGTYARACAGKADAQVGARLHRRAMDLMSRAEGWIA
ncbi:phosphotransferase family protein [Sphingomonas jatrophae]|uniref:Predicted kinase, aminoglycoside phosphotransferase (APT) family n=1 Tax=Sphingomonas jatrophae TaxID=1166337 RepID=A0A1I6KDJ9_9SPHN|nr:phosphotransferase family protein [Sphingomonas jatrophae]SFR89266.1 Predicted kinase, aminoglycoside phosphotransferase (APT) family [Sphingomonas jatrophae]